MCFIKPTPNSLFDGDLQNNILIDQRHSEFGGDGTRIRLSRSLKSYLRSYQENGENLASHI